MTIFLQDFKQYLVSNGLVEADKCFVEFCPDEPNKSVTLYKYDSDAMADECSIQIMSKDITPDAAILALKSIYDFLFGEEKTASLTLGGFPCIFNIVSTPTYLKFEENRFYYVFNIVVTTEKI